MKKEEWLGGQRQNDYPWAFKQKTWLAFEIPWHQWLIFFSFHFSPVLKRDVYNCYPVPVPPLYVRWERITCFLVSQVNREKFCPRMAHTQINLISFMMMRFGTFELMIFKWDFGLYIHARMGWNFGDVMTWIHSACGKMWIFSGQSVEKWSLEDVYS